ncbi:ABC transporter permease [Ornithinibacillus halotolerans]|uniref:Transport permease protein n=1 Tax=Ornithinibacillus halotolerans TaxID=1274357 RepID=A0A916RQE7_9BACI|nr:ABC transporter permease [Ornithinibacillus halotolerans]GGA66155.1 transport permease protein [Ornithinibacillus halotolerans]
MKTLDYVKDTDEKLEDSTVDLEIQNQTMNVNFYVSMAMFLAILRRDLLVQSRQFIEYLLMVLFQPLFFLYVFGKILPGIGFASETYTAYLAPGIIAMTAFLAGMQTIAFQVGSEFGWTREIDDRLLSPIRNWLLGLEKIVFGCIQSIIAAFIVTLLSILILGHWYDGVEWNWFLLIVIVIFTGLSSAALGLTLGTVVNHKNIGIIFGVVLTPIIFLGGPFYPWSMLDDFIFLKMISLLNPLLYVSEGFQLAMLPDSTTMDIGYILLGITLTFGLFSYLGIKGFIKRARQ